MIRYTHHFILLCLVLFSRRIAFAYDFEADGIYYHIISQRAKTVEVTYQSNSQTATASYSGVISIPDIVSYDNTSYSVTAIGDWAFCRCTSLTEVQLPSSIERIGNYAFYGCTKLIPFDIPESVTRIGNQAFYNNSAFPASTNIRYIGNYLVTAIDKAQEEYTIQNETKWIGSMAFADCSKMTNITIPSSIVGIGNHAFKGCVNLSAISIPANVLEIGFFAFQDCTSLKDITLHWTTPPGIEVGVFNGVNKEECILHIPFGSKAQWQEAIEWRAFTIVESSLGDVNEDGTTDDADIQAIANYILNIPVTDIFNEKAADVNQDGIISVSDISMIIDSISSTDD